MRRLTAVNDGPESGQPASAARVISVSREIGSERRWFLRSRARAVALAVITTAVLTPLTGMASAQAYEVDAPAVISHALAATEHEDGFLAKSLPTSTREDFAPLGAPRLSHTLDSTSAELEGAAAATTSATITDFSDRLSPFENVQAVIRDCTKKALNKTAWDIWWSWAHNYSSFEPEDELNDALSSCLEEYVAATPTRTLEGVVKVLIGYVAEGAGVAGQQQNGSSNYEDWLQVLSSEIPA